MSHRESTQQATELHAQLQQARAAAAAAAAAQPERIPAAAGGLPPLAAKAKLPVHQGKQAALWQSSELAMQALLCQPALRVRFSAAQLARLSNGMQRP